MFLRFTTSLVVLIAFSFHAVGGCCVHHAHASEAALSNGSNNGLSNGPSHLQTARLHTASAGGSCCSHSTTHRQHNRVDDEPCKNHEHPHPCCDEGSCFFAVASKVKLPPVSIAASIGTVASVEFSLSLRQAATRAAVDSPFGAGSTDRVRPLLQTWLL